MEDHLKQWNSSSYEFGTNYRPPFKSKWVPLAGRKRKTPDEQNPFAEDESPPTKQFAIDEEVAPNIIKGGYIIDESDDSNDGQRKGTEQVVQLEDMEMEEICEQEIDDFSYAGSVKSNTGINSISSLGIGNGVGGGRDMISNGNSTDDDDCDVDVAHAVNKMGLSSQIHNMTNLHQLGSVVLSEEVRASLSKKPSGEPTLSSVIPPSIVDQMYKNARAVVLWQPPQEPMSFISNSINNYPAITKPLKSKQTDENQNHHEDDDDSNESHGSSYNTKNLFQIPLLEPRLGVSTLFESESHDMEVEGVPMSCDISHPINT